MSIAGRRRMRAIARRGKGSSTSTVHTNRELLAGLVDVVAGRGDTQAGFNGREGVGESGDVVYRSFEAVGDSHQHFYHNVT